MNAQTHAVTQSSCGGGCGCNPGTCDCKSDDASCGCSNSVLVQPRFFAGQLLTDDDLQALVNYVTNSNRIHNRFVVGSGVSCGLAVTCHPCGGGRVIVEPGHAIDCCGNEIMLPCPAELDINGMVRDLKFSKHGYDCGDPCATPAASIDRTSNTTATNSGRVVTGDTRRDETDDEKDARQYCLYVNYCETPAEPVAPYTQDDNCAVTCEPSRINEGYRFELRCPTEEPDPPSIVDRIRCCIGNLGEADRKAGDFERTQFQMRRGRLAQVAYNRNFIQEFTNDDRQLLLDAEKLLTPRSALRSESAEELGVRGRIDRDTSGEIGTEHGIDESTLRDALDNLQKVGAATARLLSQDDATKKELVKQGELTAALKKNREIIVKLAPALAEESRKVLTSPLEQQMATAVADATVLYTNDDPDVDRRSIAANYYAHNSVYNAASNSKLSDALREFKAWLLRKLDECPPTGQCCLAEEIANIVIPNDQELSDALFGAAEKLARAYIRYLLDCICSALLPPCPDCDDSAVKLACFDVIDCKVDNICNLERKFLLTENNLRYWIPLIHTLGETFEKICCEFPRKLTVRNERNQFNSRDDLDLALAEQRREPGFFSSGQKLGDQIASDEMFPNILRIAGISQESFKSSANIGGNVARVLQRDPTIDSAVARIDTDAGNNIGVFAFEKLLDRDSTKAALAIAAKKSVTGIEKKIESFAIDGVRLVEEAQDSVNTRLLDFEQRLSKGVTANGLRSVKVIKDMKKELEEAKAENTKLARRLDKIEKSARS